MSGMINSQLTWGITYIEMWFDEQILASGSGFFFHHEGDDYLITNWHNLTGRDPKTLRTISESGGIPDNVRFFVYDKVNEKGDVFEVTTRIVRSELFNTFPFDSKFFVHPVHGSQVDVVALKLDKSVINHTTILKTIESFESDAAADPYVSQDVFVVGYPLGIITGLPVPIWKRGTIASEPMIDPNGLPMIYIDTATRKGMSGSVVIAEHLHIGPYLKKDGSKSDTLFHKSKKILGVYSGRLGPDNVEAQLGVVWKRTVIEEIIKGRKTIDIN